MSEQELKPCPFCGSPAKSDNGFPPAESITYAWCSNAECLLHSVDVGMTPADWNRRSLPKVDPQPPTVSVTWHESPESVHRAMWEEVAVANGMTYEQLIAESEGEGETETGETVVFTHEQELTGMHEQGCWAFVDTRTNTIHAWADEATPRELVLHLLAHEIGHITGESHPDDMQEEMRAEQFGRVAKMAYGLLPARAQPAEAEGAGHDTIVCWNCKQNVTLEARDDEDGFCPHCMCELDLSDYLINANAALSSVTAERDRLEQALGDKALCAAYAERQKLRALIAECAEYLNTDRETTIGSGSILHRQMIAAMAAKEA